LSTPDSFSFSIVFAGEGLAALDEGLLGARGLDVLRDLDARVSLRGQPHPGHAVLEGEHLLEVVEHGQDLLVAEDVLGLAAAALEEPERAEERGGRHLPPAVHPHVEEVVGVELELHPRAAVRNDPGGVQELAGRDGLALVVVEEHAGGALELRHHHALGAVDDERALLGHQGQLAEVHLLTALLPHGARLRLLVVVVDHEAERHLQRNGEGHAAVVALLHRVLGITEVVAVELQLGVPVVIGDREDGLEHRLQPDFLAALGRHVLLQKLLVRLPLDLDEIRDLDGRRNLPEVLAGPAPALDRACHTPSAL
jgi:hypothetical protein